MQPIERILLTMGVVSVGASVLTLLSLAWLVRVRRHDATHADRQWYWWRGTGPRIFYALAGAGLLSSMVAGLLHLVGPLGESDGAHLERSEVTLLWLGGVFSVFIIAGSILVVVRERRIPR